MMMMDTGAGEDGAADLQVVPPNHNPTPFSPSEQLSSQDWNCFADLMLPTRSRPKPSSIESQICHWHWA